MAVDGSVSVPNSGTIKVDTAEVTRPDGTIVERQRVVLADPTDPAQQLPVDSVKGIPVDVTTQDLYDVLDETRRYTKAMWQIMVEVTGVFIDPDTMK